MGHADENAILDSGVKPYSCTFCRDSFTRRWVSSSLRAFRLAGRLSAHAH